MRYVIFTDNKVFNDNKLWDIQDIKHKYPHTNIEMVNASLINVTSPNGKVLQRGMMISADSEVDALRKYTELRNG